MSTGREEFEAVGQKLREGETSEAVLSGLPAPLREGKILQSTPEEALRFALRVSKVILEEARKHKWIVRIQQSNHYCIEAWQAIGAPYGVTARVTRIELLKNGDAVIGAQAWADAVHNPTGRVWGQAIQVCMADETLTKKDGSVFLRWEGKGVHALIGMASTRACSRALSQVLRWIVGLAGVAGTPAEEM